jgi:hypothetical protein
MIINGDMRVAQRGTSFPGLTENSDTFTLDRWRWDERGVMTMVSQVDQSTDVPTAENVVNSLKVSITTSGDWVGGAVNYLQQSIEGLNCAHLNWGLGKTSPKTVTLSFWLKCSKTGILSGSVTNDGYLDGYAFDIPVTSSSAWAKYEITIPGATLGSWAIDNTAGIRINFCLGTSNSAYLQTPNQWVTSGTPIHGSTNHTIDLLGVGDSLFITAVQFEVGSVATPFELRDYGSEFARCERYYCTHDDGIYGGVYSTNSMIRWFFHVKMRAVPTVTRTLAGGGTVSTQYFTVDSYGQYITGDTSVSMTGCKAEAEI